MRLNVSGIGGAMKNKGPKKKLKCKMWAIANNNYISYGAYKTRQQAINDWSTNCVFETDKEKWEKFKKMGYRAIKVEVREL
jgi:hypothetical protein